MTNKFKIKKGLPREAKRSGGFTLVEILIAVSLFVVIATISAGATVSVFDANKKSQSSKTVVDNLNLAIENMTRIARFGNNYHCGNTGSFEPKDCDNNEVGDTFLAVTFGGRIIAYNYNQSNKTIERSDDGGPYIAITAPEAKIEYLRFYVLGTPDNDSQQPYIVAVIKGHVGEKSTTQTTFSIETLISQRTLDI